MDCFSKIKNKYGSKKVLILGLGIQGGGLEAASFFAKIGSSLIITDLKTKTELAPALNQLKKYTKIKYVLGKHRLKDVDWADIIVKNPSVNINSKIIQYIYQKKKELIMPSAFFLKNCPVFSIGITGTRGKSTTTNLIYAILKKFFKNRVFLAGNLPNLSALRLIKKINNNSIVVMELSSWQLQSFKNYKISPNIAVLTNIYPDHLNHYSNMQDYISDKLNILRFQKPTDIFLTLKPNLKRNQNISKLVKGKTYYIDNDYFSGQFKYLLGDHNQSNASLALKVADLLNIPRKISLNVISQFSGLAYRLQFLGTIKSIPFFNDSTSTTPIAGEVAIKALKKQYPNKRIGLILGGAAKNLPYESLVKIINTYVNCVYLLPGSFTEQIKSRLSNKIQIVENNNLKTLFKHIFLNLKQQELILFSPSATSFASFKNEFDRATQFDAWFNKYQERYGK